MTQEDFQDLRMFAIEQANLIVSVSDVENKEKYLFVLAEDILRWIIQKQKTDPQPYKKNIN
ncbi:MAG: hypothetical protein ACYC5G_04375 [Candidatus Doudnabacteria bacterium]